MIDEPLGQGFVSEFICDFLFRPAAPLLLDLMKERGYGRVAPGSEITRYVERGEGSELLRSSLMYCSSLSIQKHDVPVSRTYRARYVARRLPVWESEK